MRILITTSTFPVELNEGSPRFVFDLAKALKERGEDVEVLAPHAPGAAKRESWDGVQIRRFRYFWPTRFERLAYGAGMRHNLRGSILAMVQVPFLILVQTVSTRHLVRKLHVQVVNSHWMVPQGLTSAWARGRRRRFHHILHVHAADVYFLAKLPFGGRIARYILDRTDRVLADGSHVRDALDRLVGHPTDAVLQPMGAWVNEFRASDDAHSSRFPGGYLAFVGRLVEKKGAVFLIRALARLENRHRDVGLVIVGSGPLLEELELEVERLDLGSRVDFVGAVAHSDLVRYLRGSRLAVVPSVIDSHGETEGMPTVVVEMMAAGLPVVGSHVDGIPDLIEHGRNGWLAQPADVEDLASKLDEALTADPTSIVSAAGSTADQLDWSHVASAYVMHLQSMPVGPGVGRG